MAVPESDQVFAEAKSYASGTDFGPGYHRCEGVSVVVESEVERLVRKCRQAQAEVLQTNAESRALRRALLRVDEDDKAAELRLSVCRNNLDIYIRANAERDIL